MKHFIKIGFVILSLALPALYACSQPPAPPAGPPLAGPAGPGRVPPPPPGGPNGPGVRSIQQLLTLQGTVGYYTSSDSNVYDGFTIRTNGQILTIRFAPHMAAALMAAAKPGGAISLQGFYESTPEGANVVHLITATVGGQTLYETPPTPPSNPPIETIQPFAGTISDLRRDRLGAPTDIVLSGGRIVELTPGVYDQLQAYLKPGSAVSGSGSRLTPPPGVVPVQGTETILPHTLTLNGQTYMVR